LKRKLFLIKWKKLDNFRKIALKFSDWVLACV
jgi:hypothetical protein